MKIDIIKHHVDFFQEKIGLLDKEAKEMYDTMSWSFKDHPYPRTHTILVSPKMLKTLGKVINDSLDNQD